MSILSELLVSDGVLPREFTAIDASHGGIKFAETDPNGENYCCRSKALTSEHGLRAVTMDEKTDVVTVNKGYSPWINGDGYLSFGNDDNRPASAAETLALINAK